MNKLYQPEKSAGPTLFRQIAIRLGIFTLVFALLDVAIVVVTYSRQPEALAQELLTLEADSIAELPALSSDARAGPPGALHWSVAYISPTSSAARPDGAAPIGSDRLVDWTQRERLRRGYRISGVRSVVQNGQRRWLLMRFEGDGLRPYAPVILNEIMQHVALPLIPLAVLMLAFNIVAVRRVLNSLQDAEREVDALDPENMALRLSEPHAPREVNTLVRAFNRALGRLEASITLLRGFTANAAHELRTPLSIMQLSVERLPESSVRNELQRDATYMTRLVGQMLDLAQADALALQTGEVVDLAEVGREVVGALAPKGFRAGREIRFEERGSSSIVGHAEAIHRVYRNLIDNALVHVVGSTAIEVVAGPGSQFSVRDYGAGIPAGDRDKIFERFWRGNRRVSDGAGLGLGIVQRLVEAHGGRITVEDAPGGGALFRVNF